ncbi:UPF0488 protein CG14286 [Ceratitis capitata]|uniref:UPF0488 protein CG14286 n=1 Tax=Ceratitis capitata TaxID=7213 RepID=W8C509_CERCA|nr:UPF0488 protein CG14286 [Ceratitis capitata]
MHRSLEKRNKVMNKIKRPKSLQKPPPLAGLSRETLDNEPQIELELCWCVQQLENALNSGKLSQKIADDTIKNIRVLKSVSAPLVKKRQVMKAALGDYRAKMKEEEKKMELAAKQIKFTETIEANKKSSFLKKAAIIQTGKEFRFNFTPSKIDDASESAENEVKDTQTETKSESSSLIKDLNLIGGGFKFNFVVEENNDELNLKGLSIKS